VTEGSNAFTPRSDDFFRGILENAQIGIGIVNIQTGEESCNRAIEEILGYSKEELRRVEQWDDLVHPDDRASGAKRYRELIEGRKDKDEWEQRFIRRDGRVIVANGRFTLIRDAEGKPKYVVALSEGVTVRKSAEAERINEVFELAGKVEDAIRKSHTKVEDQTKELTPLLGSQINAIESALLATSANQGRPLASKPADPAKVADTFAQLKELLEANDADASEVYKNVADLLRDRVESSQLEALGRAVNSFDFDAALKNLDEIAGAYRKQEKLAP